LRIIKLADTLGLTELYQVALEKITGHPRKVYTPTIFVYRDEYQRRAKDVYISLPYKVKNTILLKQLELSEQNLEDSQKQRQDCEKELQRRIQRLEISKQQLQQLLNLSEKQIDLCKHQLEDCQENCEDFKLKQKKYRKQRDQLHKEQQLNQNKLNIRTVLFVYLVITFIIFVIIVLNHECACARMEATFTFWLHIFREINSIVH